MARVRNQFFRGGLFLPLNKFRSELILGGSKFNVTVLYRIKPASRSTVRWLGWAWSYICPTGMPIAWSATLDLKLYSGTILWNIECQREVGEGGGATYFRGGRLALE